jgi:hypothetical protein
MDGQTVAHRLDGSFQTNFAVCLKEFYEPVKVVAVN